MARLLQALLALVVVLAPLSGVSCEGADKGTPSGAPPTSRLTPAPDRSTLSVTPIPSLALTQPPVNETFASPLPRVTLQPTSTPDTKPTVKLFDATGKTSLTMENIDLYINSLVGRGMGGEGGWNPNEQIFLQAARSPGEHDWSQLMEQGPQLIVTDDRGNWENRWYLNGQISPGVYEIYVQGTSQYALFSAVADRKLFPVTTGATVSPVTIVPAIRAAVSQGPPGTTVRLAGNGLQRNAARFSLRFGDGGLSDPAYPGSFLKTIDLPPLGYEVLWSASFTVPEGPAGKYALVFGQGNATAYFEITSTLRITPSRAPAGSIVDVAGAGFKAGAPVGLSLKGPKGPVLLETTPASPTANETGQVIAKAKMPSDGLPGDVLEFTMDDGQGPAKATFTVNMVAAAPPGELPNPKVAVQPAGKSEEPAIIPSVAPYPLPLSLDDVVNLNKTETGFRSLTPGQRDLFRNNGFVAVPGSGSDIVQPYKDLKTKDVPVFVTSDTLLHLYHVQFNEILKRIEEEDFFNQLIDLSQGMLNKSRESYEGFSNAELKEAARRNVAYFGVALSLLQTPTEGYHDKPLKAVDYSIPDYASKLVQTEMGNIERHQGFAASAIFNSPGAAPSYQEDYSQYLPRGHYTRSEALKRFFKAMMWYGRMAFFLKGGNNAMVNEQDSRLATIQASLIASQLPSVKTGGGMALDNWNRIYVVTSFFVGAADDLTPYEYLDALKKVLGESPDVGQLTDDQKLLDLKGELARAPNPEIFGGSGVVAIDPPFTREKLYQVLAKTKGMRFMGQRYVPDSYMFQNLVFPAVGLFSGQGTPFTLKVTGGGRIRGFPRGLDIMAILGSRRAFETLKSEGDTAYGSGDASYESRLTALRGQFGAFSPAEWNRNIYWGWLYSLIPLLADFGKGYPSFMQTPAWQDKELSTALSSWAELRHDTILFAKQSYTSGTTGFSGPVQKPVVGYVEPVPRFYSRMLALTAMTKEGLAGLGALSDSEKLRLESLEAILSRLTAIAVSELEARELAEDDYAFIRNFGENLERIVSGVDTEGKETTMVADVHTDSNRPPQALEEGVGYVDLMFVAYKVPDGRIILGVGPVLSYYEFKQPVDQRLTDDAWKEMLKKSPDRPRWVGTFVAR